MKHLKIFESFNKENIRKKCKEYGIYNYTINTDGSIDVNDNVQIFKELTRLLPLKFNKVKGYFDCSDNILTSLEGCPKSVGGDFFCHNNKLTSLEGCPKSVKDFYCYNNQILSFKGCPENISGNFCCDNNQITTFEYFPKHIGERFYCLENPINIIWKLFEDKSKIELFNDMDIIQDGIVILDRLNFFLEEIGENTIKSISGYKYI